MKCRYEDSLASNAVSGSDRLPEVLILHLLGDLFMVHLLHLVQIWIVLVSEENPVEFLHPVEPPSIEGDNKGKTQDPVNQFWIGIVSLGKDVTRGLLKDD